MAIRRAFTNPRTGTVSPLAHYVADDLVMRAETRQVALRVRVYASKAAFDAGREHDFAYERTFGEAEYTALRGVFLDAVEPVLIARFFTGGTRVPD